MPASSTIFYYTFLGLSFIYVSYSLWFSYYYLIDFMGYAFFDKSKLTVLCSTKSTIFSNSSGRFSPVFAETSKYGIPSYSAFFLPY